MKWVLNKLTVIVIKNNLNFKLLDSIRIIYKVYLQVIFSMYDKNVTLIN